MTKTMQDKETKVKREILATLWSETDKLHIDYVFELIEELEQEAERKGWEKGFDSACRHIRDDVLENRATCQRLMVEGRDMLDIVGGVWSGKLKLLEEENN